MLRYARSAARWAGRHAFPAVAAAVIAVGAAGGGIGYAVAGQHTVAAPAAAAGNAPRTPASGVLKRGGAAAARAGALMQRALAMLAAQTGQSVAAVRSQLAAGKSVDAIAGGKAPAIESEILAAVTKLAGRAVKSGRLPAAQEATDLAVAKTKVEALMAEPGTQLLKDAQKALSFLHAHRPKGVARPAPSPSPAA